MRAALALLLVGVSVAPASLAFGHCYAVWKYPWAQSCGVHAAKQPPHDWFVEITQPPPVKPLEVTREQQDALEQAEHETAVHEHHDEINFLMQLLRNREAVTGQ